jgi:hypothetical protein
MAVKSDSMLFEPVKITGLKTNPAALTGAFYDFQPQCATMSKKGYGHATVMIFIDPFIGDGEGVVNTLRKHAGAFCQVVGGGAGDDGKFTGTNVFLGEEVLSEAAVLVKIFSKNRIGIGAKHGMNNCTKPMRVTKSSGNVLKEIDGRPAFEAYVAFAKTQGVDLTHETAPGFMMDHELAIQAGYFTKIRAPDAIASVFAKDTPIVGFATYGEIAQYGGLFNGWHNSTSVVCALPD